MLSLLTHSKPQDRGEVSEWFKEAVLKTVEQQCSAGSNPTLSASQIRNTFIFCNVKKWLCKAHATRFLIAFLSCPKTQKSGHLRPLFSF